MTITGAALGLPGTERIFDDANIGRILRGDQFIDVIPTRFRRAMLDKHITRLGLRTGMEDRLLSPSIIVADVIKLAGRGGAFDLESEFGISADRLAASTASRAWLSARASTPCVMPASRWSCATKPRAKTRSCPTGGDCRTPCATIPVVIFASVFPGYDSFTQEYNALLRRTAPAASSWPC